MTTTDTMQRLIEQLANTGREELARREAAKRDPRLMLIAEMVDELAPAPIGHGFAGGQQVFGDLASSRHWRHMRAKSLYTARKQQLMGQRDCAWFWLRKAAEQRRSEKLWKAKERSPFHALIVGAVAPARTERFERSEAMKVAAE